MTEFTNISAVLMAASMSEFLTHPFEVIKTKKQLKYSRVPPGTQIPSQLTMLLKYAKKRALKDLYRGFSPAIIKGVQIQTIRFGLYDAMNQFFKSKFASVEKSNQRLFLTKVVSAFFSSFVAGVTTNPWMIIKVRMIADKSGDYRTLRQSFRSISKKDGYKEFMKGSSLSMIRGIVLSTVELTVYDTFKDVFRTKDGLDMRASFMASLVASLSGALVSYPLDVLRTIYMFENSGGALGNRGIKQIFKIIGNLYQTRGIRGFYGGFMPCLSKSLIYGPLFWNSLELFSHFCKKYMVTFALPEKQI